MLTESTVTGSTNVTRDGRVHVRRDTTISRDGVPIGEPFYDTHILIPGDSLTNEDPRVALIATAAQVPLATLAQALALLTPLVPKAAQQVSPP